MIKKRIFACVAAMVMVMMTACGKTKPVAEETDEYIVKDVSFDGLFDVPKEDNHRVFYEIFVGSFSDSNGDGLGDLRGIINRFDYLNDGDVKSGKSLGIEGIWLSPINESPSYHKYDVADYYAIDDEFGTMDDLKELVKIAHERNVKIIMDFVMNHSSKENEWFEQFCTARRKGDTANEYYDFYTCSDTPLPGRRFEKIAASDWYYECNFSGDMPEMNYDNPKVKEALLKVARYYLEDIGVDGFRFDAAKYVYFGDENKNAEFWLDFISELKKIKPDIYTVAEVWDSDNVTDQYEPALNCFNFTMSQAEGYITEAAKKGDVNKYVAYVDRYIDTIEKKNASAMIIPFIANHDTDRAAGYLQSTGGFAKVAANLYILGPGSPFIYYGEEIGMKGSRGGANTDANRRLAMLWGDGDTVKNPMGSDYDDKLQTNGTLSDQLLDEMSLYNYYKRLIMIRRANPEIYLGEYTALSFADSKAGGFISEYNGKQVCVLHNTTASAKTLDLSEVTQHSFNTVAACIGVENTEEILETGKAVMPEARLDGTKITIPAQSSVVLR